MKKPFLLKCGSCNWQKRSTGISSDLKDLKEIQSGCKTCGKVRKFRCPECSGVAKMHRVSGNT